MSTSRGGPAATTRPPASSTIRSAYSPAMDRSCMVASTVRPRSRRSWSTRSSTSCWWPMSRALVGSSSSSSGRALGQRPGQERPAAVRRRRASPAAGRRTRTRSRRRSTSSTAARSAADSRPSGADVRGPAEQHVVEHRHAGRHHRRLRHRGDQPGPLAPRQPRAAACRPARPTPVTAAARRRRAAAWTCRRRSGPMTVTHSPAATSRSTPCRIARAAQRRPAGRGPRSPARHVAHPPGRRAQHERRRTARRRTR